MKGLPELPKDWPSPGPDRMKAAWEALRPTHDDVRDLEQVERFLRKIIRDDAAACDIKIKHNGHAVERYPFRTSVEDSRILAYVFGSTGDYSVSMNIPGRRGRQVIASGLRVHKDCKEAIRAELRLRRIADAHVYRRLLEDFGPEFLEAQRLLDRMSSAQLGLILERYTHRLERMRGKRR